MYLYMTSPLPQREPSLALRHWCQRYNYVLWCKVYNFCFVWIFIAVA